MAQHINHAVVDPEAGVSVNQYLNWYRTDVVPADPLTERIFERYFYLEGLCKSERYPERRRIYQAQLDVLKRAVQFVEVNKPELVHLPLALQANNRGGNSFWDKTFLSSSDPPLYAGGIEQAVQLSVRSQNNYQYESCGSLYIGEFPDWVDQKYKIAKRTCPARWGIIVASYNRSLFSMGPVPAPRSPLLLVVPDQEDAQVLSPPLNTPAQFLLAAWGLEHELEALGGSFRGVQPIRMIRPID